MSETLIVGGWYSKISQRLQVLRNSRPWLYNLDQIDC